MMKNNITNEIIIYQGKNGTLKFRGDFKHQTIWATQKQIAELFGVDVRTVNEHLRNIFKSAELDKNSTIRKFQIVQKEGKRMVKRIVNFYNLDAIISVGYRVNSKRATQFRIWATKTLRQYLLKGYVIDKKRVAKHYEAFLKAVQNIKALLPQNNKVRAEAIVELIKAFANTWLSLEAYDKDSLPIQGVTTKQVSFMAEELVKALRTFKEELIKKNQATELFGQERETDAIKGIIGNILQSVLGKDAYPTIEEKAAHLLYFIVKDHPFIDGNKRSGAFAFIWFLQRTGNLRASLTPEALTALTLLIAESKPKDKGKMIGLILLFLRGKYE